VTSPPEELSVSGVALKLLITGKPPVGVVLFPQAVNKRMQSDRINKTGFEVFKCADFISHLLHIKIEEEAFL
jgi:hypothetical protein